MLFWKRKFKKKIVNNDEIIYFSVNNWFSGRDYPPTPNFKKWLGNDLQQTFENDKWAKKNKLCIYHGVLDMSFNYTVSAPRAWVEKNCPELLTDEEYNYVMCTYHAEGKTCETIKKKYSDFVYKPYEGDETPDKDRFGMPFRKYCKENFGSKYYETNYWDNEDDDEEDND